MSLGGIWNAVFLLLTVHLRVSNMSPENTSILNGDYYNSTFRHKKMHPPVPYFLQCLQNKSQFLYRGRILGCNWDKILRVLLLAIHSHLYQRNLLPPPLWAKEGWNRVVMQTMCTETSSLKTLNNAQKPQRNCTFMKSASSKILFFTASYLSTGTNGITSTVLAYFSYANH